MSAKTGHWDEFGNPVDDPGIDGFATWDETEISRRSIARTAITTGVAVSTLCLGHEKLGDVVMVDGEPRLFETMIIGGPCDGQLWPLATRFEAQRDHVEAVLIARSQTSPS